MPRLELTENELVVHMSKWEAIAALHPSIRVPLSNVRGATDDPGFRSGSLGLRMPGTAVPGLIYAGTFIKGGDRQFAFMTRKTQPVVIELANEQFARIILGVADPRAAATRINAAIENR